MTLPVIAAPSMLTKPIPQAIANGRIEVTAQPCGSIDCAAGCPSLIVTDREGNPIGLLLAEVLVGGEGSVLGAEVRDEHVGIAEGDAPPFAARVGTDVAGYVRSRCQHDRRTVDSGHLPQSGAEEDSHLGVRLPLFPSAQDPDSGFDEEPEHADRLRTVVPSYAERTTAHYPCDSRSVSRGEAPFNVPTALVVVGLHPWLEIQQVPGVGAGSEFDPDLPSWLADDLLPPPARLGVVVQLQVHHRFSESEDSDFVFPVSPGVDLEGNSSTGAGAHLGGRQKCRWPARTLMDVEVYLGRVQFGPIDLGLSQLNPDKLTWGGEAVVQQQRISRRYCVPYRCGVLHRRCVPYNSGVLREGRGHSSRYGEQPHNPWLDGP